MKDIIALVDRNIAGMKLPQFTTLPEVTRIEGVRAGAGSTFTDGHPRGDASEKANPRAIFWVGVIAFFAALLVALLQMWK
ncbi:MAG: hypothetical protein QM715_18260 [Nibricoccus sp.]